jgi:hypothetical protein
MTSGEQKALEALTEKIRTSFNTDWQRYNESSNQNDTMASQVRDQVERMGWTLITLSKLRSLLDSHPTGQVSLKRGHSAFPSSGLPTGFVLIHNDANTRTFRKVVADIPQPKTSAITGPKERWMALLNPISTEVDVYRALERFWSNPANSKLRDELFLKSLEDWVASAGAEAEAVSTLVKRMSGM